MKPKIFVPSRICVQIAAWSNHHWRRQPGGFDDFGGAINAVLEFSRAASKFHRFEQTSSAYIMFVLDLAGGEISRADLEAASGVYPDRVIAGLTAEGFATVNDETITLTDAGARLAAKTMRVITAPPLEADVQSRTSKRTA